MKFYGKVFDALKIPRKLLPLQIDFVRQSCTFVKFAATATLIEIHWKMKNTARTKILYFWKELS